MTIRSAPGTWAARQGIELAKEEAADVVLLEEGVGLAGKDMLSGYCGTAYALDEDLRAGGPEELEDSVKIISAEELEKLLEVNKVIGTY